MVVVALELLVLHIFYKEKGCFSLTLAPLFVKDLGNIQFPNNGVKVEICNWCKAFSCKNGTCKKIDFGVN